MKRTITTRFEGSEGPGTWFYDVTYWRTETASDGSEVEVKDHVEAVTMEGLVKQRDELSYALGNTVDLIEECEVVAHADNQVLP